MQVYVADIVCSLKYPGFGSPNPPVLVNQVEGEIAAFQATVVRVYRHQMEPTTRPQERCFSLKDAALVDASY
jgi:hypothetical protein